MQTFNHCQRAPYAQKGFSLLEILVAFSILAISLGILLNIFSGGLRTAILSEDYVNAITLSESLLSRMGTEFALEPGEQSGDYDEKYSWTVQVEPFFIEQLPEQENPQHQLYSIHVAVFWGDGDQQRSMELDTLRLANIQDQ